MICALSWSGGKDSTLALHRARAQGLDVQYLFNIYEGSSGRVRFHGVRAEVIAAQARSLRTDLVQRASDEAGFEATFDAVLDSLEQRDVEAVVFGNIHLSDVRAWYEERTTGRGLRHIEPLWGDAPADVVREFIESGYRALIVSVDLTRGKADWLGREIDSRLVDEIARDPSIDPCGEHGEFHSFAFDGPLFDEPLAIQPGRSIEMEGHRLLDLQLGPATD